MRQSVIDTRYIHHTHTRSSMLIHRQLGQSAGPAVQQYYINTHTPSVVWANNLRWAFQRPEVIQNTPHKTHTNNTHFHFQRNGKVYKTRFRKVPLFTQMESPILYTYITYTHVCVAVLRSRAAKQGPVE